MSDSTVVKSSKLLGHQGSVLCLDHSSSLADSALPGLLLSGSEDGTARLWDSRSRRAALCMTTSDPVLSTVFVASPSSSAASVFAQNVAVYLATGSNVYGYDLRQTTAPIMKEPTIDLALESQDEVNQLSLSTICRAPRSEALHLAAGDDAGQVRVMPLTGDRRRKMLHHGGMVTAVGFRPHSRKLHLASGGTDCRIALWDLSRPHRALCSLTLGSLDTGTGQVCNPPMVSQLAWSPSGRWLLGALGDGSLTVLAADAKSLTERVRLADAHNGAVANVLFPEWRETSSIVGNDRLLCSAGNDAAMVLWDMGAMAGVAAIDPQSYLPMTGGLDAAMGNLQLSDDKTGPSTLFGWQHEFKPNWLASSRGMDPCYPSSIFVADTSNDITVYTVSTS